MAGETHSFACNFFADTLHFKQDGAGANLGNEELGATFAATHFDVERFARDGNVRRGQPPDRATRRGGGVCPAEGRGCGKGRTAGTRPVSSGSGARTETELLS